MVKSLPDGCRLIALFDSCHSGSALALPYSYDLYGWEEEAQAHRVAKLIRADVILWSICKDDQNSADTFEKDGAIGAMNYAFLTAIARSPHLSQTYQQLLISTGREIFIITPILALIPRHQDKFCTTNTS